MNTLCNHGFVPHDGRNITLDKLTKGLKDAINIAPARALNIFETALSTNPIPNATVSNLLLWAIVHAQPRLPRASPLTVLIL